MSFGARREYFRQIWKRYQSASKKGKTAILNEYCAVCGFSRKYAIRLLGQGLKDRKKKSGPKEIYDQAFVEILFDLWQLMQRMCGKKMKVALPGWLPYYGHDKLTKEVERKLKIISASHIDRLLAPFKKIRGRSTTKAGNFLKTNIPIQTRHDGAKKPGYLQADTVAHCGSDIRGAYVHTLTVTDIFSNWTENRAVFRKNAEDVLSEYLAIEKVLPFLVLAYSSDNGGEVMNEKIWTHLHSIGATMTRGRPYRKNDNPHVEQKNNTHVRKLFGYQRFEHRCLVNLMNEIYENYWNPLQNFFTPSMKLISKERVGARYVKKYDKPQTPYRRLMKSSALSKEKKAQLKQKFESLNPIHLSQRLEEKRKAFFKMVHEKRRVSPG
jgi:hypothetical protein